MAAPGDKRSLEPRHCWSFAPDGANAAALSAEVNRRLIDSLRYVFREAGEAIRADRARTEAWIASVERAPRPDPLVHTLFHSLVAEIEAGAIEASRELAERLIARGPAGETLRIRPIDEGEDAPLPAALIARFVDLEEENRLALVAPDPDAIAPATALVEAGLGLVARNDPELDGEFRALVSEIWMIGQHPDHRFTTAAVSCFQNWGGLVYNPAVHAVPLDVVELIAHEATHLLLFALALDEPLLTNPPEERYHSPLREAPRSMDGVFHATIVGARIVRAMLRQTEAEGAGSKIGGDALDRAAYWRRMFDEGVEIIEADAKLTSLGRRILDDSKAFVTAQEGRLGEPEPGKRAIALAGDA